ncbi:DUF4767 domain-containing protein [Enterococcus mundtii]|uniref:DUF4767 domain-containing protein n=1 Tax=Enterococcus mundtii TaxID=53346 RepID=UPI0002F5EB07|nr:DUF4767 domain-containing protein [Enterococcus mundtii]MDB7101294.1 DUF4767 domain-containing protein [Enterococcus mundtii]PTO35570.1 DUF4767 domain-containing protein [Enterococcus mundtii]PTO40611.1 DUF4767 domain-containing protein [Enterococcus mundtii]
MKKWLILLIGMGVLLTGCTSNEKRNDTTIETKKSTVQSTEQTTSEMKQSLGTSTSESSTTESSTEEVKNTLWDHNKSAQLETFVIQWGKTLGQTYKSYSDTNPVSQYGTPLPNAVIDGSWKFLVDNAQMPIQWSTTGENNGTVAFQLVAVYSDMETSSDMIRHTYFFGFKDNQPKIYITQQNQGNENNYMYFSETQNQQLKQGFVDIVNGQAPQTLVVGEPNQQVTTTTTQDATTPASPDLNERAQAIREILKQNQGFNEGVLNSIPDEEIIDSFVGNATNAQLAQSAMNLLEKYPNLK